MSISLTSSPSLVDRVRQLGATGRTVSLNFLRINFWDGSAVAAASVTAALDAVG
jgi:hypothetical protein